MIQRLKKEAFEVHVGDVSSEKDVLAAYEGELGQTTRSIPGRGGIMIGLNIEVLFRL